MAGRASTERTAHGGTTLTAKGNKPDTPYEPCFVPVHVIAPAREWHKALNPVGPFYRVSAIFQSDDKPSKDGTVSETALGDTVTLWSRLDGVYCVVVHPL